MITPSSNKRVVKVTRPTQLRVGQRLHITSKTCHLQQESDKRVLIGKILIVKEDPKILDPIEQEAHDFIQIEQEQLLQGEPPGDRSKSGWMIQISELLFYYDVEIVNEL